MGDLLFRSSDASNPALAPGVLAIRGYEDSGLSPTEQRETATPSVKDLGLLWDALDSGPAAGHFGPANTVLVDDQWPVAARQPASLILADHYGPQSDPTTDDWLVLLVGALDNLSHESNMASAIEHRGWNWASFQACGDDDDLFDEAITAAKPMGIVIEHPHPEPAVERVDVSNVHPALLDAPAHDDKSGPAPLPPSIAIRLRVGLPRSALPWPLTIPSSSAHLPLSPPSPTISTTSFSDNDSPPSGASDNGDSPSSASDSDDGHLSTADDDESSAAADDRAPSRFVREEEALQQYRTTASPTENLSEVERLAAAVQNWEREMPDQGSPLAQSEPYDFDRPAYYREDLAPVRGETWGLSP